MKRTIILSPYKNNFSGTAELIPVENSIKVRLTLNHPGPASEGDFRVYALSTSRAAAEPCVLGVFSQSGTSDEFMAELTAERASEAGYRIADIDTCLVTVTDGGREEAVAAAFFGLEWNAARFLNRKSPKVEPAEAGDVTADTTVGNARRLLEDLKSTATVSDKKIEKYIDAFRKEISRFEKCNDLESDGFEWYKITLGNTVTNLSSVRHVLSGGFASAALNAAGYYIAGIRRGDARHIAIGIPGCRHVCPMPQLSDCCSYSCGYHIAGIYLGGDGQYFEKYLQNE